MELGIIWTGAFRNLVGTECSEGFRVYMDTIPCGQCSGGIYRRSSNAVMRLEPIDSSFNKWGYFTKASILEEAWEIARERFPEQAAIQPEGWKPVKLENGCIIAVPVE